MIEIRNAEVVKSGVKLFQHLNWQIRKGENWIIRGPNGSGKTILLEMIAGDRHLTQGELRYDFIKGETWDDLYKERKSKILFIPAHALRTFLHHEPGVYYQQRYYRLGDERVPLVRTVLGGDVERLERLKIPASLAVTHLLDLEITRLSNGQLKKVLFVSHLLKGIPRLLLMDYPFEGLDRDSRKDLCDFIDFLAEVHSIQMMLVDHHHHLPRCINRRLMLENHSIVREETFAPKDASNDLPKSNRAVPAGTDIPIIEIRDLNLKYGNTTILKDFNWTVYQGERWALVGRNGAGKTTLFSMIFADHPMAYSQAIWLFGRRRGTGESIWDIKRRINYVGAELLSYLGAEGMLLTAREFIAERNKGQVGSPLDDLVVYFQAQGFIDIPIRFLSSGQLQLMLIMNSFLSDRELLLLDEPFQFLDMPQRARVNQYLQAHLQKDTTLILITHDEQDLINWAEKTKHL